MGRIRLTNEDIGFITIFEGITGATVKDCIYDKEKEKITFIVSEGQAGIAIGRGGINIKKLEDKLKKKIEVLEFSKDPLKFLANIFRPVQIKNAYISEKSNGEKTLYASISKDRLGMAKSKAKIAKELLKRYFDFQEVILQ